MSDLLLNMIWTVSAGLLSLVAVFGIFVSISSQQKIQKRREIFWELFQPKARIPDRSVLTKDEIKANANQLQDKYKLYNFLEETEAQGMILKTIEASVFLIWVIIIFWMVGIGVAIISAINQAVSAKSSLCELSTKIYGILIFIGLFVLATIAIDKTRKIIESLKKPLGFEDLPTIKSLLDVCNTTGCIDVLNYLIQTMFVKMRIQRSDTKEFIQVQIVYPLPFFGFYIKPEIEVCFLGDDEQLIEHDKSISVAYDGERCSSERARPLMFAFELGNGAKDKIKSVRVSVEIQAGKRRTIAKADRSRTIDELNEWQYETLHVLSWMTEEEMEKFDWGEGIVATASHIIT